MGKALQLAYFGSYDKTGEAHYAMGDYIKDNNLELNGAVIEEFITDPANEPDTSKWQTNIYYMIK
jgi:effector-binding domain-containing protein